MFRFTSFPRTWWIPHWRFFSIPSYASMPSWKNVQCKLQTAYTAAKKWTACKVQKAVSAIKTKCTKALNSAVSSIEKTVKTLKNTVTQQCKKAWSSFCSWGSNLWNTVASSAMNALEKTNESLISELEKDDEEYCFKDCNICLEAIAFKAELIALNCCSLSFHSACFDGLVQSKLSTMQPGHKVTLSQLGCMICKKKMKCSQHAALDSINQVFDRLQEIAVKQLEYDNRLSDPEITEEKAPFFRDPAAFSMAHYTYYICSKCKEPFCAGSKSCAQEFAQEQQDGDEEQKEKLCSVCEPALSDLENSWCSAWSAMVGTGIWLCPNNHVWFQGGCSWTSQTANCETCGALIGNAPGQSSHNAAPGNRRIGKVVAGGKIHIEHKDPYTGRAVEVAPDGWFGYNARTKNMQFVEKIVT